MKVRGRRAWGAGFTLIELMIVVMIIGILAAVAVPAFMRYVRRSKTVEATMNVRKMFDASVAYYTTDHTDSQGNLIAHQFPLTQTWSPNTAPAKCCLQTGGKCDPALDAPVWRTQTWTALNFSLDDPFYYAYQYTSGGQDSASTFSAQATGDLDCDSTFSLFMRIGSVSSEGNVTGGSSLYSQNENE